MLFFKYIFIFILEIIGYRGPVYRPPVGDTPSGQRVGGTPINVYSS